MIDLRIDTDTTPYRRLLYAPRDGRKPAPETSIPLQGTPENPAVAPPASETRPSIDPLASPSQSVSPALAARIYQANIPTELFTYPFHVSPDKPTEPAAGSGHASRENHEAVTMIHYEPGTLVDSYV